MAKKNGQVREKHFFDYSLLIIIIFLTVFGLIMIYSASSYTAQIRDDTQHNPAYYMVKQAWIAIIGFAAMLVVSSINYRTYVKFGRVAYIVSLILMILVSIVGTEVNGKKRWLKLGPLSFQPTELVKLALIVLLAGEISHMGNKINELKNAGVIMAYTLPAAALVAANNLSSGIIVVGIAFVMLFVACRKKLPFFALGFTGLGALAFAGPLGKFLLNIHMLKPYQYRRIEAWLNPELDPEGKGFQILQGLYAIGSGGIMGQGLGESIQKLGFLPESQNDMVFAIICEELGLFGAVTVLVMFLIMIFRFMLIASNAPDLLGLLLVVGVMGHIAIQVILNVAVVTNTIPNTGITLPFISYGGTSVLILMVEMGIALGVSRRIRLKQ